MSAHPASHEPRHGALLRAASLGAVAAACAAALGAAALVAGDAAADDPTPRTAGEFNTPYGQGYGEQNQPFDPRTRGSAGGRVIINGRILLGEESSTLGGTLGSTTTTTSEDLWGTSQAIGNQLNVIVDGDWNTVIVDSTQTNNGDVSAGVGVDAETSEDD
jgi:holdfast attachment protein HfaA